MGQTAGAEDRCAQDDDANVGAPVAQLERDRRDLANAQRRADAALRAYRQAVQEPDDVSALAFAADRAARALNEVAGAAQWVRESVTRVRLASGR
jgi:hypothetical protein